MYVYRFALIPILRELPYTFECDCIIRIYATLKLQTTHSLLKVASELYARPLEAWDVTDTLLASDIEGALHGLNRTTGEVLWTLPGTPLVQIVNQTHTSPEDQRSEVIWAVEPLDDGRLYYFSKEMGLQEFPVSIKHLVLESPFVLSGDDKIYTGAMRSLLYDIRVSDGEVLGTYGPGSPSMQCPVDPRGPEEPHVYVSQTIYELTIQGSNQGKDQATWKVTYASWGPNNMDKDLVQQSRYPRDMFLAPNYDASVLAMDLELPTPKWVSRLPAIAVNVFDIFLSHSAELAVLPHPLKPDSEAFNPKADYGTFLDQTSTGSWYAMSGFNYPLLVASAPRSQYWTSSRWHSRDVPSSPDFENLTLNGVHKSLVLETTHTRERLPSPAATILKNLPATTTTTTPWGHQRIPKPIQPVTLDITEDYLTMSLGKIVLRIVENAVTTLVVVMVMVGLGKMGVIPPFTKILVKLGFFRRTQNAIEIVEKMLSEEEVDLARELSTPEPDDKRKKSVTILDHGEISKTTDAVSSPEDAGPKRRKRGSRGGKKNKKESEIALESLSLEVDSSISSEVGSSTKSEGSLLSEVGSANSRSSTGNLVISDTVLGYGSHGTVVYKGTFESRPVAVKRMLLDFFDVAQHEVALLQESDDHPNVVRYFCSQESEKFLYIALELCSASLEDVVEKAQRYPELSSMRPNTILYQIACGLNYLHSLKIVHRDLKPQNILVAPPKHRHRGEAVPPRTLISDFGLCKKLEADQSSFRATTANAAGTAGWRAPELLVDEHDSVYNNIITNGTMTSDLNHSIPGMNATGASEPLVYDSLSKRKLTRAIDVFSMGCVFYYVLTSGQHPFGDRYLREGNIIKGEYCLDLLDVLPDAFEARHLIAHMIARNPRLRLDSLQIMKHPYFWLYEKRFDFLLKVSDRFEVERRDPPSPLLLKLEEIAPQVVGKDWRAKFGRLFLDNLGKYRKYHGLKLMDLLRALRNKYHHFNDMPEALMEEMGPLPDGFYAYFNSRFPNMLMEIYFVVQENLADEQTLRAFY
ncbi:hypothetical protein BABINDRAFT_170486 [Babjeviella inositovora NRRL Y-12698]|uniref:non-specific serine/threonine protein kinase n=1 Tax=Babjeviella inositovora NRRL Y-12698 TaxID=984486 RepID=A0A1E3QW23_9ASCO|nr:uncharacterized protein BABINDRAFT_170486 [Babjeviella inositovora NRRL Y-12698]ODQ81858.1 hypothetical protein BABINDRAFT_170486 [Babjeviella inositovora NRRL Y-12698]